MADNGEEGNPRSSRRTFLKGVAVGGAGVVAAEVLSQTETVQNALNALRNIVSPEQKTRYTRKDPRDVPEVPIFVENPNRTESMDVAVESVTRTLLVQQPTLPEIFAVTDHSSWPMKATNALNDKFGLSGTRLHSFGFDYDMFAKYGEEYLKANWGTDYLQTQMQSSSKGFLEEQKQAEELVKKKYFIKDTRRPDANTIQDSLTDNLIIALVDTNVLYQDPSLAHSPIAPYLNWVVVYKSERGIFVLNDSGPKFPKKSAAVSKDAFMKAYRDSMIAVPREDVEKHAQQLIHGQAATPNASSLPPQ